MKGLESLIPVFAKGEVAARAVGWFLEGERGEPERKAALGEGR